MAAVYLKKTEYGNLWWCLFRQTARPVDLIELKLSGEFITGLHRPDVPFQDWWVCNGSLLNNASECLKCDANSGCEMIN